MKKDIDNLLARYFGGNTTKTDMQDLENWISESLENQFYFDEMTNLYAKLGGNDLPTIEPNTEKAKKAFISYISKENDNRSKQVYKLKSSFKNWMFRAASVAVFVVLSLTFWKLFLSEHEMVLATQQTLKQELLPDRTEVNLSQNSKITYSSNFAKSNKIIKLEGEANFTVGSAGKGKLKVIADETFIEDIGTVFAVTAYPDSNYINVKVREGQVHFYTKSDKGLIIKANEAGVYNKKTKTFKVLVQKLDSLAAGIMHVDFQAIALSDAVDIISNAYSVDIQLAKKSIGNKRITVNFDGEDVNVVLQIMAETLNLNLEKGANGYVLSEKN